MITREMDGSNLGSNVALEKELMNNSKLCRLKERLELQAPQVKYVINGEGHSKLQSQVEERKRKKMLVYTSAITIMRKNNTV